jgi:CRP-like cAMP-binding protein
LLSLVGRASRDALLEAGTSVKFSSGDLLLQQGNEDRHVLLLLTGTVKILFNTEDGCAELLGIRVGGDLIGEMAALDGSPRSATVVAGGVVHARSIGHSELRHLMTRHADLQDEIIHLISQRLRWANERRIHFRTLDSGTRVNLLLLELAERCGRPTAQESELGVHLTQRELASLAGVALPTLEKALRDLSRDGLIDRRYRLVIIRDLDLLRTHCKKPLL